MTARAWMLLPILLAAAAGGAGAGVRLNEFVTGNLTGITDEDGDHEDWIERRPRNSGRAQQRLRGHARHRWRRAAGPDPGARLA